MRDRADEGTAGSGDAPGLSGGSDTGPPPPSPQVLTVSGALDAPGGPGSSRPDAVLVLSSPSGASYHLPIDGTLRAALRQATASASGTTGSLDAVPDPLRPKDIQRRIRAGESVAELADSSGLPVAQIERYAGPVLAERAHIAALASATVVREQRSRPVLADLVRHRLSSRGVALSTVVWDAWRRGEQGWALQVSFRAGTRDRLAQWAYDSAGESVEPLDDEARWLSASHEADGPGRRLSAVRVFDVEADGDIRESPAGLGGSRAGGSASGGGGLGASTGSITGMNTGPAGGAAPTAGDQAAAGSDAGPAGPWTAPDHDEVAARTMDLLDALSDRRGRRQPVPDLGGDGGWDEDGEDDDLVDALLDLPSGAVTRPGAAGHDLPFGEPPTPPALEPHLRSVPAPAWDGSDTGELPEVDPWQGPGSSGHPDEDGRDHAGAVGAGDAAADVDRASGRTPPQHAAGQAPDVEGMAAPGAGPPRAGTLGLVPPLPTTGAITTAAAPPRGRRDEAGAVTAATAGGADARDTAEAPPGVPAPAPAGDDEVQRETPARSRTPRRPSVPSWDEIVFGSPRPDAD